MDYTKVVVPWRSSVETAVVSEGGGVRGRAHGKLVMIKKKQDYCKNVKQLAPVV